MLFASACASIAGIDAPDEGALANRGDAGKGGDGGKLDDDEVPVNATPAQAPPTPPGTPPVQPPPPTNPPPTTPPPPPPPAGCDDTTRTCSAHGDCCPGRVCLQSLKCVSGCKTEGSGTCDPFNDEDCCVGLVCKAMPLGTIPPTQCRKP